MSEKLFKFLLTELGIIRLACKKCGTIVELTIDKLEVSDALDCCPHCKEDFRVPPPGIRAALGQLGAAIRLLRLQQAAERLEVQFILRQTEGP